MDIIAFINQCMGMRCPCIFASGIWMRIVLAITGASGIAYGTRALELLKGRRGISLFTVISDGARDVAKAEGMALPVPGKGIYGEKDFSAPFASGSMAPECMLVAPCSLKTLAAIANGYSDNLVSRSAEVCLKEGRKLVLVVRETPLSSIALENMLKLSRIGVVILPASPGFYQKPGSVEEMIDFVVSRAFDNIGIKNSLYKRWMDGKKGKKMG